MQSQSLKSHGFVDRNVRSPNRTTDGLFSVSALEIREWGGGKMPQEISILPLKTFITGQQIPLKS